MNTRIIKSVIALVVMIFAFQVQAQKKFGGLALYTVRNDMTTDAKTTLKAVADAGYKNIEAAGYADGKFYKMTPLEFKTYVK